MSAGKRAELLELLGRARILMQAEGGELHAAGQMLTAWQHRAADARAAGERGAGSEEGEREIRELLQTAALIMAGSPAAAGWLKDVERRGAVDRGTLAAGLMKRSAELLEHSAELVWQRCVRSRLGQLAEEIRWTAGAVKGSPDVSRGDT